MQHRIHGRSPNMHRRKQLQKIPNFSAIGPLLFDVEHLFSTFCMFKYIRHFHNPEHKVRKRRPQEPRGDADAVRCVRTVHRSLTL